MGDTVFNIFGTHFEPTPRKQLLGFNAGENANVGKSALLSKGVTPSKINKNISTPKNVDLKKRTFLQNEGASIQVFCPKGYESKKNTSQPAAKSGFNVFCEDVIPKVNKVRSDNMIDVEYNRKPAFYEDESDDEFTFSDKQLDDVVLGLPKSKHIHPPKFETLRMEFPDVDYVADDSLNYASLDEQDMNIDEFAIIE